MIDVESITLSPAAPIICQGNSYYLGKTITPLDAYYENIEWSSDDESIVTVDENGLITGISPGTANVTATIGEVSATVPVTVYAITSNVADPDDNAEVIDAAGDIIDDIINNDNPDISNTDIDPEDLDEIRDDIVDGIENGDAFYTDIVAIQQYFDLYKKNWGQIQRAARDLNAQFAGAYNIEVEMYHRNSNGNNQHIGNITELDNEITFTFDLPTGMSEQQSGTAKKYVLVRIHRNSDGTMDYSPIDYTINEDGTFTASSDMYSDFVWCVVEDTEATYSPSLQMRADSSSVLLDIRIPYVEGAEPTVTWGGSEVQLTPESGDNPTYGYFTIDCAIKNMTDPRLLVVTLGDTQLYSGEISVASYLRAIVNNYPDYRSAAEAMLRYGAAAQIVFNCPSGVGEDPSLLANFNIPNAAISVVSQLLIPSITTSEQIAGAFSNLEHSAYYGMNMTYTYDTSLLIAFRINPGESDEALAELQSVFPSTVQISLDATGNYYIVKEQNIPIGSLANPVFTINGIDIVPTDYLARIIDPNSGKSEDLMNLCRALYAYYLAVTSGG